MELSWKLKSSKKLGMHLRFVNTAKINGHEVKLFLMGEAVECENLSHEEFDVAGQIKTFYEAGGEILACGSCLKSRNLTGTDACRFATMIECIEMVEWADKVVTF